jgi:hypothetical protein
VDLYDCRSDYLNFLGKKTRFFCGNLLRGEQRAKEIDLELPKIFFDLSLNLKNVLKLLKIFLLLKL